MAGLESTLLVDMECRRIGAKTHMKKAPNGTPRNAEEWLKQQHEMRADYETLISDLPIARTQIALAAAKSESEVLTLRVQIALFELQLMERNAKDRERAAAGRN
jgi:hypothetical protein